MADATAALDQSPGEEHGVASLPALYARIARTYAAWARPLLALAAIVFVPLGLVSAIPLTVEIDSLNLGSGLLALGLLAAALALVGTSLVGEVFYSGAVAVSLTRSVDGRPFSLREISRHLDYRALIAVDLIYSVLVIAGLALLVVPGVLLYIWLGLAGPVVEIERRGVRAAFARSARLVRGHFWLGDSLWSSWLSEALSNIVATPFLAVAAVLVTVELIVAKDGRGPRLHSTPSPP
jgi:hypothetical protein